MQIMTKINDFEEIFFKSSIIFHVFAHSKNGFNKRVLFIKSILFCHIPINHADQSHKRPHFGKYHPKHALSGLSAYPRQPTPAGI